MTNPNILLAARLNPLYDFPEFVVELAEATLD